MRASLVGSIGLGCAAAAILAMTPTVEAQRSTAALVQGGEPANLILLYTGDVIGYIEPCG